MALKFDFEKSKIGGSDKFLIQSKCLWAIVYTIIDEYIRGLYICIFKYAVKSKKVIVDVTDTNEET